MNFAALLLFLIFYGGVSVTLLMDYVMVQTNGTSISQVCVENLWLGIVLTGCLTLLPVMFALHIWLED